MVVEVGAGTGLTSIIAARCGARSVLATDREDPEVLGLLARWAGWGEEVLEVRGLHLLEVLEV